MPRTKSIEIYEVCPVCRRRNLKNEEEKNSLICQRCAKRILKTDQREEPKTIIRRRKGDYWL